MSLALYWGSGSPFAWRCLLALEIKRISFESKLIEFSRKDHQTPEFLRLNPRGKVPVLVDGEVAIWESLAILVYLDRKYPETPIFGHSPLESGKVWQTISELESYLAPPARELYHPLFTGKPSDPEKIASSDRQVVDELRMLQSRLSDAGWLVGSTISAADIVLFPTLGLLDRMLSKPEAKRHDLAVAKWREHVPSLAHWYQRLADLPGVAATYPPHWK